MTERNIPLALEEYYHIYNRGNSKQIIYKDTNDYKRFMSLLFLSNGTMSFKMRELGNQNLYEVDMGDKIVSIGAYCLIPNHFHILLKPLVEEGVSLFMKKLSTGYSMYFNRKYDRKGGLFEGRFKSQHVDSDVYLKYLFSYIHLNPVKLLQSDWKEKGIIDIGNAFKYLDTYIYSSYLDLIPTGPTCGNRVESVIVNQDGFPLYFDELHTAHDELLEWITYSYVE